MHLVLVHGAGGTANTWSSVVPLLEQRGLAFTVADNYSQSLRADEAAVRALIDAVDGPVLLVGHSYGGAVITAAGTHERVVGLVYAAAFGPDRDESVQQIVSAYEPAEVSKYFTRGPAGEWIAAPDEESWRELAWDVPESVRLAGRAQGRVAANDIFTQSTAEPAWMSRPSWYLVASSDKHLRPEIQRAMAARMGAVTDEVDTSHAVAHAAPERVVATIEKALAALV
ncbi:pimeloyl-ACP methyl ester carboxylesterase [Conyzicola lurida]|uniref:Pimeloyl-ACP methyl ester carboxylesterase n=1 Tax=Conyzicola lurida TaxID=1172621 RepID=A0A841AKL2_9MICO|nr:alpha/beta hydrolase [Conyzicola lurida]MBB5843767.1 pimeloyl-ACP methyl ester carboxylesterase [Conyzicola lurida]